MTDDEYIETQTKVAGISALLAGMDLRGFLERIHRAEALGAVVDPTLYNKASGALAKVGAHARALRTAQRAIEHADLLAAGRPRPPQSGEIS